MPLLPWSALPVCLYSDWLLKLQPCYSQVTLELGSTIWCWCNLQTYENSLLPRAVKQPKLGVRWNHIHFMNEIIFQTLGLEVSDAKLSFAILPPAFWFGILGFLFFSSIVLDLVLCADWSSPFLEMLKSPDWGTTSGKLNYLKRSLLVVAEVPRTALSLVLCCTSTLRQ